MTKPNLLKLKMGLAPDHSRCPHPECDGGSVPDHEDPGFYKECSSCHGIGWIHCLEGPDGCGGGKVEFRSTDGYRWWPRCGFHFEQRMKKEEHIRELTSPMPAQWFYEADAGEVWSEEDY